MTIKQAWKAGLGPADKPYSRCEEDELCWGVVAFLPTVDVPF